MSEVRERIYSYTTTATFIQKKFRQCMHRTSLCPDQCGHSTFLYEFHLDQVTILETGEDKLTRFCTPVTAGENHFISQKDMNDDALVAVADSLVEGASVRLDWNHDYVTKDNCSSPERPVIRLEKI